MTQHSDQEILALYRDGKSQKQAFRMLAEKYQRKLYWMIRRMVIEHADADDILQNVLIKIWGALDTFREDAKLYSWIYRITYNETLTFLSQKKRDLGLSANSFCDHLENLIDQNQRLDCEEIEKKLQQAILTLPEMQRMVFQLRYYDDMTYEDIAEVTGLTTGGLKASYHVASKKIEKFLLSD